MIKYYAGANTCDGYVSFIDENIAGNGSIVIASGTNRVIRQKIFEDLKDVCTELIMKTGTADDYDAVITPKGAVVFTVDSVMHGEVIEFSSGQEMDFYKSGEAEKMYSILSSAKEIHDDWEKIYISSMDFSKMDSIADDASKILLSGRTKNANASNKNRFFGSMTAGETVNFIDDITQGFKKRVFIKGRPGTGKSTLLKKVREAVQSAGFDTETYHCSFDPGSLDMIAVRELGVCIFDSTSPHEMFPSRTGDELLDVYELAVDPQTDEKNADIISKISKAYAEKMREAKKCLYDFNKSIPKPDTADNYKITEIFNKLI